MEGFLAEVRRVLRPGGAFLFADFRPEGDLEALRGQLGGAGMTVLREMDITSDVVESLERDGAHRLALMNHRMKGFLRDTFVQFAGLPGSKIYEEFARGTKRYVAMVLRA